MCKNKWHLGFPVQQYGIFNTILKSWTRNFKPGVTIRENAFLKSSIEVFNSLVEELLPTPTKSHYTFNLRDLSKVFQGILMVDPLHIKVRKFLKLCTSFTVVQHRGITSTSVLETDQRHQITRRTFSGPTLCSAFSCDFRGPSPWTVTPWPKSARVKDLTNALRVAKV